MVLEKIRNKSGLLLVVIGLGMFAFLAGDFFSSLNGGPSSANNVGDVNGESVDIKDFETRVQTAFENQSQNNPNIDVAQIRNSVWNQIVRDMIFQKEFDELGLIVGSEEAFDMIQGDNIYPSIQQTFINPETGLFDKARLIQYLKEDIYNDETGASLDRWLQFERAIVKEKLNNKFVNMVSKGLSISEWEKNISSLNQNENRSISFLEIPFKTIDDSLVSISDKELMTYMRNNEERYQQEESRDIEYVVFSVDPSNEDKLAAENWINDVITDFANASDDQSFINNNSDSPSSILTFVSESDLDKDTESLYNSKVGTVVGPYSVGFNKLRVAKLVDVQNRPDSVKARHILISSEDAIAKIDSVKKLIENGASFASLAKNLSEDTGSGSEGGNLGWFAEGRMVAQFNEACFTSDREKLKVVTTQFGVHLIEVTNRSKTSRKVKVGFIDRDIYASNETYQEVFSKAGRFAAGSTSLIEFNESLVKQNLTRRIADNLTVTSTNIAGLENPRSLIKWVNEASQGDVSEIFEFGNKFVVALLTKVREKGLQDLEDVRAELESLVRTKKKGEMLLDQLSSATDLDQSASEYGVSVKTASGLTFANNQVAGLGNEPFVVGASFAVDKGQTTNPFLGKNSLFMVRVDDVTPVSSQNNIDGVLLSSLRSKTNFQLYQALEDLSEINNNLSLFY
jgi:peptidyl-prolyl cis-trans isomerase D